MLVRLMLFASPVSVALGGIENPQVIRGQVGFQQSGGNTTITASDQSIINYSRFDIGLSEKVQFIQPGSSASVLNRILSANPSRIDGALSANGRVFFINPAGVIIGGSAKINVSQLVASGLNMSDADFLNQRYSFAGGDGSVVNSGEISAESVYLVGKEVINSGSIRCPNGSVVMAAGDTVFLGQAGSDILVQVGTLEGDEQLNSENVSQIINEGQIEVGSGKVVLAAAGDIFFRVLLKNTGSISARSDSDSGGTVTVEADEVINSGTIDVSGTEGGSVVLEGASRVGQFGTVNADGTIGDGGGIEIRADEVVVLGDESLTTANAGADGDGGEIVAYSPGMALFREGAQVEAQGGSESGDGGFFELSGEEYVEIEGNIDLTAASGRQGEFLIDPLNIRILPPEGPEQGSLAPGGLWIPLYSGSDASALPIDRLEWYLGMGDVTLVTSVSGPQDGWVEFAAGRPVQTPIGGNASSLRVDAVNYIRLYSGIEFWGTGNVELNAGTYITIDAPVILNGGGTFTANSGLINPLDADIVINDFVWAGSIILDARGNDIGFSLDGMLADVELPGPTAGSQVHTQDLTATSGNVEIHASDNTIHLHGDISTNISDSGDIILHNNTIADAGVRLDAGGDVILAKDKTLTGLGALTVEADEDILLGMSELSGIPQFGGGHVATLGNLVMAAGDELSAYGTLSSRSGSITLSASDNTINLWDDVIASQDLFLTNNTLVRAPGKTLESVNGDFLLLAGKTLNSEYDLTVEAGRSVWFGIDFKGKGASEADVTSQGDMTVTASDDLVAGGDLTSVNGSVSLYSSDTTTHLGGDVTAATNVLLNNNTVFDGPADQTVDAQTGTLTANGSLHKTTTGSLYLHSGGDMTVSDYLAADLGGISLISDTGRIHSDGAGTLDIPIAGVSDGTTGVDLPNGGKAAIVVNSPQQDLNMGSNATLTATGTYDPAAYDDRSNVNFLDTGTGAGDPIDIAVYLASFDPLTNSGGNVDVASPTSIASPAVMVVDAYGSVTFNGGSGLTDSLVAGTLDGLELCSRISDSLAEATGNGRLPEPWLDYFTPRGGSPTAAPVLEGEDAPELPVLPEETSLTDPPSAPDLRPDEQDEGTEGGDLLWLARELGLCTVSDDETKEDEEDDEGMCMETLHTLIAGAFLMATDVAPWDTASKLREMAALLQDPDGRHIAALTRVVGEFANPNTPPSPEQFASIAQALAQGDKATHYADAGAWLNALADYVGVLQTEIGWTAEDSIAFVMDKYAAPITESVNVSLIAFVQMHLETPGG
jgi:filamentous hemagglutinin family protein